MKAIYDDIGIHYSVTRCTDPEIASQLYPLLDGASRIINIGAGAGSYEPEGMELVAVEPSTEMISQRKSGSYPVERAFAEKLPFDDNSFSHAMTILSMHHWSNTSLAFDEINRVATERFVAITWDPKAAPFWLTRDYFPEIYKEDQQIFPDLEKLGAYFDSVCIEPLEIPADCKDGLLPAFWKRPEAYLQKEVRQASSAFAKLKDQTAGLQKLKEDLASGVWKKRNRSILNRSSLDVGFKLISAAIRKKDVRTH